MRKPFYWFVLYLLFFTGVIILGFVLFFPTQEKILTVAFLDVGQGDSIFIETPNRTQVLIDGGPDARVMKELGRVMPWHDRSIDMVIATHPDKDHIAGLVDVVQSMRVTQFVDSGFDSGSILQDALTSVVGTRGVEHVVARRGMRLYLDAQYGVYMDILYPIGNESSSTDSNDMSVMARLVYGESEFLFTGDSGVVVENKLVSLDPTVLDADVVKLGHHGSRTSSAERFLRAVDPELAIVSAGCDNSYGHPHDEVVERLYQLAISALSTCNSGTIILESDGTSIFVKE